MHLTFADALFFIALIGIWLVLAYWIFLSIGSALYSVATRREVVRLADLPDPAPFLSVLVPAHNEALVIEGTVRALVEQTYPHDRYEIIVVNDGSTDETGAILTRLSAEFTQLVVHDVPPGEGGRGKSRTLNVGLRRARGSVIAVFDADNTAEPDCLRRLVSCLLADPTLVAVNGKIRTRNADATWLTRFVNLEFIYFQWLFQAGRWFWFRLSLLMGTNYVIYRNALELLGNFDESSLVDDTEMSLRIFRGRRRIRWVPFAVAWEQEPQALRAWLKQRSRWTMGNLLVTQKYLPAAFAYPYPLGLEILTFALNYVLFMPALIASDLVCVMGLLGWSNITFRGPFFVLWGLSFLVYVLHMQFAIEREDPRISNSVYAVISYFTYAQLFPIVLALAAWGIFRQQLRGGAINWVKTERTRE